MWIFLLLNRQDDTKAIHIDCKADEVLLSFGFLSLE
jgi:hypothetical protein